MFTKTHLLGKCKSMLVWYHLFWPTIQVSIMRISLFFDTSRILVFDGAFIFNTIQVYISCKNFHT